jgi:L-seryl-tRNA(Ser) seleniumtransferase
MSDFSVIPSIDRLRQRPGVRALEARFGAGPTIDALRAAADAARRSIAGGQPGSAPATADGIEAAAAAFLGDAFRPSLVPVINATGVIIHTNLGRAPLSPSALARVVDIASGYSSLEYDLRRGSRGRRDAHAEPLLCRLTGAESAVVVNNNAAATLLLLAAIAAGREVIVSRGELVEIGGGFRVPDVMAQSGAVLREVGTTNKTRASDYAAAVNERTALILRVHPSNFRIEGFTQRPTLAELVTVGRKCQVPVAEDLGSGYLLSMSDSSLTAARPQSDSGRAASRLDEPTVAATVAAGVDVCCFSGDKLLGGPQAGIVVGRSAIVERIRTHPLMRALRVDKMTYGALEATLADYAAGRADTAVPVRRMLAVTTDAIRARADTLVSVLTSIDGWQAEIIAGVSAIGGGSAPGVELPTWLVSITRDGLGPDALEARLRGQAPPIVARIERDRLLLDLRTVLPEQDGLVASLLRQI